MKTLVLFIAFVQISLVSFCQEKAETKPKWNFLEIGASTSLTVYTKDDLIPKLGLGFYTKIRIPTGNHSFFALNLDLARIRFAKTDFFYQKGTIFSRADFDANVLSFGASYNILFGKKKSFEVQIGPQVDFVISTRIKAYEKYFSPNGTESENLINREFGLKNSAFGLNLGFAYKISLGKTQSLNIGPILTWRIPSFGSDQEYINLSTIGLKIGYLISAKFNDCLLNMDKNSVYQVFEV